MTIRIGVSYINENSGRYYLAALRSAGAEPVVLASESTLPQWPTKEQSDALMRANNPSVAQLDELDGLLLTGGGDIDPMLYREPMNGSATPNWPRDHLEMAQFHRARAHGLPIFCICRGLQFLNVALGGSLVQDLPSAAAHRDPNWKSSRSHLVRTAAGSALARIVSASEATEDLTVGVNSYHHQGITQQRLAPGLVASAYSTAALDSELQIAEGLETTGTRNGEEFILGVQWHPERVADATPVGERQPVTFAEMSRRLFQAFVEAAAKRSGDEGSRKVLLKVVT